MSVMNPKHGTFLNHKNNLRKSFSQNKNFSANSYYFENKIQNPIFSPNQIYQPSTIDIEPLPLSPVFGPTTHRRRSIDRKIEKPFYNQNNIPNHYSLFPTFDHFETTTKSTTNNYFSSPNPIENNAISLPLIDKIQKDFPLTPSFVFSESKNMKNKKEDLNVDLSQREEKTENYVQNQFQNLNLNRNLEEKTKNGNVLRNEESTIDPLMAVLGYGSHQTVNRIKNKNSGSVSCEMEKTQKKTLSEIIKKQSVCIQAITTATPITMTKVSPPRLSSSQAAAVDMTLKNTENNAQTQKKKLFLKKCLETYTIKEIMDKNAFLTLAIDQNGSRHIQKCMENAHKSELRLIYLKIKETCQQLCTDVFGNYVVQKFLEFGLSEHKRLLITQLIESIVPLCLDMYGCRVIQKILDISDSNIKIQLLKELKPNIYKCIIDQNGNHVIQKCIEKIMSPKYLNYICRVFESRVTELSQNAYGCRVIQRLLEFCTQEQKVPLLNEIVLNAKVLMCDQYGNYVIQHVLKHKINRHLVFSDSKTKDLNGFFKDKIVDCVCENLVLLSRHKFASNVVECCFIYGTENQREKLVNKVIGTDVRTSPINEMVRDQFANYVVQKILRFVNEKQRKRMILHIKKIPNLRKITFGKHIIACIDKLCAENMFSDEFLASDNLF